MPIASAFRLLAHRPDVPLNPTDPRLLRSMVQPNNTLLDCISSAPCTFKSEPPRDRWSKADADLVQPLGGR